MKAGQPIARLDSEIEKSVIEAGKAELAAAKALLTQTEIAEARASELIKSKAVSQSEYDDSLRQLKAARAQVQGADARLRTVQEQLDFTTLKAEADGVVTEKGAEVGEVVAAGQMIVRIARNKPIDAIFDVPESVIRNGLSLGQKIEVRLNADKKIRAEGTVYEIAPQSDSATRTYLAKAAIDDVPSQMLLGATVVGFLKTSAAPTIQAPASSLTTSEGRSAVWVVDPATKTVRLTPVKIEGYTAESVVITEGLESGDIVVTAGVQALYQKQRVKLTGLRHDRN